jgi:outer membrane protein OmpA-like peptidoglycan-associated protein
MGTKICPKETLPGSHITITTTVKIFNTKKQLKESHDFVFTGETPNPQNLIIRWGEVGAIEVHTDISYAIAFHGSFVTPFGPQGQGHYLIIHHWLIKYNADGTIDFHEVTPSIPIKDHKDDPVVAFDFIPSTSPSKWGQPWFLLVLRITPTRSASEGPVKIAPSKGPASVSVSIGGISGLTMGKEFRFQTNIVVVNKPVPKGVVTTDPITIKHKKTHTIWGFATDKSTLDSKIYKPPETLKTVLYKEFWMKLSEKTRSVIKRGMLPDGKPIEIEGHTDKSGTESHNLDVGTQRAKAVKDLLEQFSGQYGGKVFIIPTKGQYEAQSSQKEDPKDRKVVIKWTEEERIEKL